MFGAQGILFDPLYQLMANQMNTMGGGWSSIDLSSYVMFRQYGETIQHLLRPKMNVRYNRFKNRLYLDINWGHRNWNSGGLITEDNQLIIVEGDTAGDDIKEQILFDLEKTEGPARLYAHGMGTSPDVVAGDFLIIECMKALDPEEFPDVYNSTWIKRYFKAKVMLQWGQNLAKYSQMQLPGGVVLDGQSMKQEAEQEIEKLFEALYTDYASPLSMLVG